MKFLKLGLLFCLMAIFMVSCEKDNVDESGVDTPPVETVNSEVNPLVTRGGGNGEGLDLDCFTINYPFSLVDVDGVNYEITEESDFETVLTEEVELVDFVYPLTITNDQDEEEDVADAEALGELFASCVPSGGWDNDGFPAYLIDDENSCYDFAYPMNLRDINGDIITVNDQAEFNAAVAADLHFFEFPIDLVDEEGEVVSVNDIDELFAALFSCNELTWIDSTEYEWESGFEYIGCLQISFPLTVVLEDGTEVTVNNHEEYCDLMLRGDITGFAYPLTVTHEDGTETVVNNEVEFEALLAQCEDWYTNDIGFGFLELLQLFSGAYTDGSIDPCYTISYPIEYNNEDGTTFQLNSLEDLTSLFDSAEFENISTLNYPINVTIIETAEVIDLNSFEDIIELASVCQ